MLPKRNTINIKENDGFSMVSVLVALAISGILALVVASFTRNAVVSAKFIGLMNEKEDIRNLIRVKTDCAQTKLNIGTGNIVLYDRLGKPIANKNTNNELMIQKWVLRVTAYNALNGAFTITAMHPDRQGANGAAQFKRLFDTVPFTCK